VSHEYPTLAEQRHQESKVQFAKHTERLMKLEFDSKQNEERLHRGAAEFERLREASKPMSAARAMALVAPGILSLIGIVATVAWAASRYPDVDRVRHIVNVESPYVHDRPTVMRVVNGFESESKELHSELVGVRVEQVKINAKLDSLIEFHRKTRRKQ